MRCLGIAGPQEHCLGSLVEGGGQDAVISLKGCDCKCYECHEVLFCFVLERKWRGSFKLGGIPRSLQQLSWGPRNRLEPG